MLLFQKIQYYSDSTIKAILTFIGSLAKFHVQDFLYNWSHVVVFVFGKAATEEDVGFMGGESAVLVGKSIIALVVHGIELLHTGFVLGGVFFADDCLGYVVDGLTEHLKMFVLNDTRIRHIVRGVVDDSVALIVWRVLYARLERDRAPIQATETEIEILINRSGVD